MLPVIGGFYRPHLGSFPQATQIGHRACPQIRVTRVFNFGAQFSTHYQLRSKRVRWMEMQSRRPEQVHQ